MVHAVVRSFRLQQDFLLKLKSYRVEHAVEIAADAFEFVTSNYNYEVSNVISAGDFVRFFVGEELAMEGIIDDIDIEYTNDSNDIRLTGRDVMSRLLDNDANPNTYNKLGLSDYLAIVMKPYGIKYHSLDNTKFDKITVSPGENDYSVIERLCKERNLVPLYDVNSQTLWCTKPRAETTGIVYTFSNDYDVFPTAFKIKDCQISISNDIRHEVIVYGGDYEENKNIKGSYKDPRLSVTKRRILNESSIETNSAAENRAKEEFYSLNKNALTIEISTITLKPVFVNMCARVYIKKIGFDGYLLIDSVRYTKSITAGSITNITLKLMPGQTVNFKNNVIPTLPVL